MQAPSVAPSRWAVYDEFWRVALLAPALTVAAVLGGVIAGRAAMGTQAGFIALPIVVVIPFALWRWPAAAPLLVLGTATVIEQYAYKVGTRNGPFTDRIPFFRTFAHGTTVLPVEALLAVALLVWLMKSVLDRSLHLPRSQLAKMLLVLWVLLLVAFGIGISRGAQFNFALWELRPWLLLSVTYIVASQLLRTPANLRSVMWVLVLGSGFKALQGVYIFLTYSRHLRPRPEAILGHEEAFFFGLFIILTLGLWLYDQRGHLRLTATILLPMVVVADLANARRTAWAILFAALGVLLVAAWFGLPDKRRLLAGLGVALSIASAVYFPLYWNHNGALAQPARAIKSGVTPDSRDQSSNLYRSQEAANLRLNIQQSGILGKGFGVPINYALPIADISSVDSMIKFIPHNGLLWVWMRLGLQGEIVLWLLVGTTIIGACQLAKAADRQMALLGAFIACAAVGYVIQGYEDVGLASLRIAVAMGCLLGCLEAASRMVSREQARDVDRPSTAVHNGTGEDGQYA